MAKEGMQELAVKLRECGEALLRIADAIELDFPEAEEQPAEKESPAEKALVLEDVRAVLAEKSRLGYTEQVRGLLKKYGADRLSAIKQEDYRALLADAEVLGDAG